MVITTARLRGSDSQDAENDNLPFTTSVDGGTFGREFSSNHKDISQY